VTGTPSTTPSSPTERPLLDADINRFGNLTSLGLDEVLTVRIGPFDRHHFSTQMVDVRSGQLLDIVPGRGSADPIGRLTRQGKPFRHGIEFGTLDLSGPYRRVFEVMVPRATLVSDPFHVCKLANTKLDECRQRVQNETLGHRGRKSDPLYRCRRLLTKAKERLDEKGKEESSACSGPVIRTATWLPVGKHYKADEADRTPIVERPERERKTAQRQSTTANSIPISSSVPAVNAGIVVRYTKLSSTQSVINVPAATF
jgi:hypothetical protein